jgi:hypothetical protein
LSISFGKKRRKKSGTQSRCLFDDFGAELPPSLRLADEFLSAVTAVHFHGLFRAPVTVLSVGLAAKRTIDPPVFGELGAGESDRLFGVVLVQHGIAVRPEHSPFDDKLLPVFSYNAKSSSRQRLETHFLFWPLPRLRLRIALHPQLPPSS